MALWRCGALSMAAIESNTRSDGPGDATESRMASGTSSQRRAAGKYLDHRIRDHVEGVAKLLKLKLKLNSRTRTRSTSTFDYQNQDQRTAQFQAFRDLASDVSIVGGFVTCLEETLLAFTDFLIFASLVSPYPW